MMREIKRLPYTPPATAAEAELQHLNHYAIAEQVASLQLEHQVSRVRLHTNASWQQIADLIGVTKQAAMKRFGGNHDCQALGCGLTR